MTVAFWLLAVGSSLAIGTAYAMRPTVSQDSYEFLASHRPFANAVYRSATCYLGGNEESQTNLTETRFYRWKGDFATVSELARKELAQMGFEAGYTNKDTASWDNDSDVSVWIHNGFSKDKSEALGGRIREPGVTVTVSNPVPETLIQKARAWIEPNP